MGCSASSPSPPPPAKTVAKEMQIPEDSYAMKWLHARAEEDSEHVSGLLAPVFVFFLFQQRIKVWTEAQARVCALPGLVRGERVIVEMVVRLLLDFSHT